MREGDSLTPIDIQKIDFMANRHGIYGVLDIIFRAYYKLDLASSGAQVANLRALVLKRLVLFSLPIPHSVLADFPAVNNSLKQLLDQNNATRKIQSHKLSEEILEPLQKRHLIITIHSEGFGRLYDVKNANKNSDTYKTPYDKTAYHRFSLHSLVREHLAKRMRYAEFDHGEHSFFDVSLYATQPRDLPSLLHRITGKLGSYCKILSSFPKISFNPYTNMKNL